MFKEIMSNPVSKLLIQIGVAYIGVTLVSQLMLVITAIYAPYVIGVLLVIIAILNVKVQGLSK